MQMIMGICLSVFNSTYFRQPYNIAFEFLPQMIFLLSIFGYVDWACRLVVTMTTRRPDATDVLICIVLYCIVLYCVVDISYLGLLIIIKWLTDWTGDPIGPPRLMNVLINMLMSPFDMPPNLHMYFGQVCCATQSQSSSRSVLTAHLLSSSLSIKVAHTTVPVAGGGDLRAMDVDSQTYLVVVESQQQAASQEAKGLLQHSIATYW
jgi:hypothetical protein